MAGLLLLGSVAAQANQLSVKSAELVAEGDAYVLNADFEASFDHALEEALAKGVPISFLIEFQIVRPYQYWFNDEIITLTKPVTIHYYALTRQYLVGQGVHQQSFETLSEAKRALTHVRDWKVIQRSELEEGRQYQAALLMRLDKTKLPKAIQADAFGEDDWDFASPIHTWSFKHLK